MEPLTGEFTSKTNSVSYLFIYLPTLVLVGTSSDYTWHFLCRIFDSFSSVRFLKNVWLLHSSRG